MKSLIYLDYNATTPVNGKVAEEMLPYFSEKFGNAASHSHTFGLTANKAVEHTREQVANAINASSQEIIFTSGSTEAINLALKGIAETYQNKGKHIITCKTEHKAVLDTCEHLSKNGFDITYLDVDRKGIVDLKKLNASITDKTVCVCIMLANNETGVIQPIKDIAEIVHTNQSILMSDATQAIGKIPVDVNALGIDALCMSAHKVYGPKGIGALFLRRKQPRVVIAPQMHGGGHEHNKRSGTLNVPGIVGLGKACELMPEFIEKQKTQVRILRDKLETGLTSNIAGVKVIAYSAQRLPNTSNIQFPIKSNAIIKQMMDVAVSTGSACTSAKPEPSHVLLAMDLNEAEANSCIRFSLGLETTKAEIDYVIQKITTIISENPVLS